MPRQGLNRTKVIAEARVMANENGLNSISIHSLARRLNIRPPSLYRHLSSLDDLINELHLLGLKELQQTIISNVVGVSGKRAVKQTALAYRQFAKSNPGLYGAMQQTHLEGTQEIREAGDEVMRLIHRLLIGLNDERKKKHRLEDEEFILVARSLRSVLHGFVDLELQNGFGYDVDLDKTFEYVINNWLNGLKFEEKEREKEREREKEKEKKTKAATKAKATAKSKTKAKKAGAK